MCGAAKALSYAIFIFFAACIECGAFLAMIRLLQSADCNGVAAFVSAALQIVCCGLCLRPPQVAWLKVWHRRAASMALSAAAFGASVWQLQESNKGTAVIAFVQFDFVGSLAGLFVSAPLVNACVAWCERALAVEKPRAVERPHEHEGLPLRSYEVTGCTLDDSVWFAKQTIVRAAPYGTALEKCAKRSPVPAVVLRWAMKRVKSCVAHAQKLKLHSEVTLITLLDTAATLSALFVHGGIDVSAFNSLVILSELMDAFLDAERVCHIVVLEKKSPTHKTPLNMQDNGEQTYESMRICMMYLFAAHASARGSAGACAVVQRNSKSDKQYAALENALGLPAPRTAAVYKGAKNSYAIQLDAEENARLRYVLSLLDEVDKHDDVSERVNEDAFFLYESECYRVLHDAYERARKN